MATEEEAVIAATQKFYDALEDLLQGRSADAMSEACLHDDFVTTVHPFGHWARGWKEVFATWQEVGAIFSLYRGHANRDDRIGNIYDLRVAVLGDVAYTTGVFKSLLYLTFGEATLKVNCTNILHKRDGVWKVVHHHPDQASPDYQAKLGRMVQEAQGG
jgi:ketosteroid isomerase-like protein